MNKIHTAARLNCVTLHVQPISSKRCCWRRPRTGLLRVLIMCVSTYMHPGTFWLWTDSWWKRNSGPGIRYQYIYIYLFLEFLRCLFRLAMISSVSKLPDLDLISRWAVKKEWWGTGSNRLSAFNWISTSKVLRSLSNEHLLANALTALF